ncbi:MAG: hypothetical protein R2729_15840 [Bryobacteraceae bacterium]
MRRRVSDIGRGGAPTPPTPLRRGGPQGILFVCLGNAIRSQMAEAFARKYGSDVIAPASAGLTPAAVVAPLTLKVMKDRGLDLTSHFPKAILEAPGSPWDQIVNISGERLPPFPNSRIRTWEVADPVGGPEQAFVETADKIEGLIMQLILDLRSGRG